MTTRLATSAASISALMLSATEPRYDSRCQYWLTKRSSGIQRHCESSRVTNSKMLPVVVDEYCG